LFDNSDFVRVGLFGFKPALAFVVITKFSPDLLRLGCFIEPALAVVVLNKFSPDLLRLGGFGLESLPLSFMRFTLEFLPLGVGCCFDFVVRVVVGRFVRLLPGYAFADSVSDKDLVRLGAFGLESLSFSRFTPEFLLLGGGCCFDFVVGVMVGRFVRLGPGYAFADGVGAKDLVRLGAFGLESLSLSLAGIRFTPEFLLGGASCFDFVRPFCARKLMYGTVKRKLQHKVTGSSCIVQIIYSTMNTQEC
jgi:hypothetical protein